MGRERRKKKVCSKLLRENGPKPRFLPMRCCTAEQLLIKTRLILGESRPTQKMFALGPHQPGNLKTWLFHPPGTAEPTTPAQGRWSKQQQGMMSVGVAPQELLS